MTKSILTGIGVFATFAVIMAGLAGAFELTAGLAVALLFVWFIFVIFFARFGGFKPFFVAAESTSDYGSDTAVANEDSSSRRLISVGAEVDEAQSLFGQREPVSTDDVQARTLIFNEHSPVNDSEEAGARAPLFGDALSDQLKSERGLESGASPASAINQVSQVRWAGVGSPDDEAVSDDVGVDDERAESESQTGPEIESGSVADVGIVVDDSPDWVSSHDDDDDSAAADESDGQVAEAELNDFETSDIEAEEGDEADILDAEDEIIEDEIIEDDLVIDPEELVYEITEVDADSSGEVDLEDIDAQQLAAAFDSIEPTDPADAPAKSDYVSEPVVTASTGLSVGRGTELPVVVQTPEPLELHKYSSSEIMAVVKAQEGHLVDTLIDEGVLSTQGPLTDKDVRTMVFVAVSSTELIEVLTEGQRDAVALNGGGNHALGSGS